MTDNYCGSCNQYFAIDPHFCLSGAAPLIDAEKIHRENKELKEIIKRQSEAFYSVPQPDLVKEKFEGRHQRTK